ncbi:N-acetylmuramidase family protein [Agrobacterium vitis]|uniref:Uncharacterized protein n=1 Tax=Agrobacterium vitis TaxID=373 RepID=A0A368NXN6_AGRVI|nr:hypothetical protein [Agrobacterium vitis]KAA3507606.1 hypothetical protein DXM22_22830 [Agrobacterium vitis]KAA3521830.1 hypothetical protein DXT89_22910 [Agrobacterium vitis]MCF1480035.1 N-acetylmuramidase family protein [Agrobacterium vitis]MUZ98371.1 hypothetical protein [Agrobacterium vitis]MVA32789.1 hypothetical protein [Agrobacterium vitis]
MNFIGTARRLSLDDFVRGARRIGCEVAALRSVAAVEARGRGFDAQNRPIVLPEVMSSFATSRSPSARKR